MLRKINVCSLDFDGCLGNDNYQCSGNIVDANPKLIKHLTVKKDHEKFTKSVLMVGSNRQDLFLERDNSRENRSCYQAMTAFHDYLNSTQLPVEFILDKFLLADKALHDIGTNFNAGLKEISDEVARNCNRYYYDDSKVVLLYAQMNRMASLYPDAEITFDFYDDRENLQTGLLNFFHQNPFLLPPRMVLRFYHYHGDEVELRGQVDCHQDSIIDEKYLITINKMIECAGYDPTPESIDKERPNSITTHPAHGEFGVLCNLKNPENVAKFCSVRKQINQNRFDQFYVWNADTRGTGERQYDAGCEEISYILK